MITINDYEFNEIEFLNPYITAFTDVIKDGINYTITRCEEHTNKNLLSLMPGLSSQSFFIPHLASFTFTHEGYTYLVYQFSYPRVMDFIQMIPDNTKEHYVRYVIKAIYNIHAYLFSKKSMIRLKLESFYLHLRTLDDKENNRFDQAEVKMIFNPYLIANKAGTPNYMDTNSLRSFDRLIDPLEYTYKVIVNDLGRAAQALLPRDSLFNSYISDDYKDFIKVCLQSDIYLRTSFSELKKHPFFSLKASVVLSNSIGEKYIEEPNFNYNYPSIDLRKENKVFSKLTQKKMIVLAHCYSYFKNVDNKLKENKRTLKEEAFEAADKLFDKITLNPPFEPELFPLSDTLVNEHGGMNKSQSIFNKNNQ